MDAQWQTSLTVTWPNGARTEHQWRKSAYIHDGDNRKRVDAFAHSAFRPTHACRNEIWELFPYVRRANPFVRPAICHRPEPEAWMLMLLGFGIAGVSVRRRYATTAPRLWPTARALPKLS